MSYSRSTRFATPAVRFVALAGLTIALACSGGTGGSGGPDPDPVDADVLAKASQSGDFQAGLPGAPLPGPLRVIVTNGSTPVSGKSVAWQVTSGGGQVGPATSTTGADGTATTTVTLPQVGDVLTIQASASNVSGSPVSFTALVATTAAEVSVQGPPTNQFVPQAVAIRAGGTVTFTWPATALEHNLLPDDGQAIPNEPVVHNGPFSVTVPFPTAGEYFYHCSVHGGTRTGMYGRVVVVP